jgi:hypothetical protein
LHEADQFPPTAVGFNTNSLDVCDPAYSLDVCDSAFSLAVVFVVSTDVVLSARHVSSACVDMQCVALATVV